jgi:hypothetical protein
MLAELTVVIHWFILSGKFCINNVGQNLSCHIVCDGWKGRKLKEMCRLKYIILTEEVNQLHRNGNLLVFKDVVSWCTYFHSWPFSVTFIGLHKSVHFKTAHLALICFHDCTIWEQHHTRCMQTFTTNPVISIAPIQVLCDLQMEMGWSAVVLQLHVSSGLERNIFQRSVSSYCMKCR